MIELFTEHWVSLVFGLISAGALAYAKYISSEFKHYKKLKTDNEQDELDKRIKELIQPIQDKLEVDFHRFESIKQYFKYIIIEDCENLLQKGYMTTDEYQRLSETFKAYHGIGGNSQAEDYYHKAINLTIRDDKKKGED